MLKLVVLLPIKGCEGLSHLCTGDASSSALTSTVEFSTATLVRPCGCWFRGWCGWRGNGQISSEWFAARSEGHIVNANVTSVAISTNTFNQNLSSEKILKSLLQCCKTVYMEGKTAVVQSGKTLMMVDKTECF